MNIEVSPDVARAIAREAYIFGFAPVYAYRSMHNEALARHNPDYRAPINGLGCKTELMSAKQRTLPGPNADTPVCVAWLDLRAEPRFDFEALPPEYQQALRDAAQQGLGEIRRFIRDYGDDPLVSTKILGTRESLEESARQNYGHDNYHLIRAAAAELGIFGNIGQEAIYRLFLNDADDQPLDASKSDYTMTFAPGDLPPVRGFWSLSMYDAEMFFVDNPLDRYLLNSRMLEQGQLEFDDDDSLTFYISADAPSPERRSNWLPAPDGPFRMIMRMYGPSEDAQKGRWTPPRPLARRIGGAEALSSRRRGKRRR